DWQQAYFSHFRLKVKTINGLKALSQGSMRWPIVSRSRSELQDTLRAGRRPSRRTGMNRVADSTGTHRMRPGREQPFGNDSLRRTRPAGEVRPGRVRPSGQERSQEAVEGSTPRRGPGRDTLQTAAGRDAVGNSDNLA